MRPSSKFRFNSFVATFSVTREETDIIDVCVCVCVRVGGWVGIKEGSRGEMEHEERDGVELDTAKKRER